MKKINKILPVFLLVFFAFVLISSTVELPNGKEIMEKVNARNEGEHLVQNLKMTLKNKRGRTQVRDTKSYRKDFSGVRKTILLYTNPSNVKGTAFMSFDYDDSSRDDDQWLYLPSLRKTKRISAANRGDYFLGTDFTFEDIKLGAKMSSDDYEFETIKEEVINGKNCYLIEGTPINKKISRELGYSKIQQWVDKEIWLVIQSKYWDIAGNPLKTTFVKNVEKIQGIWTFQELEAINHKSGHKTSITFSSSDYNTAVDDDLFSEESLIRGVK